MRRRILHCIPSLAIGGAERQLSLLSAALPPLGWDVHILTLYGGTFEDRVHESATMHRIASAGNFDPLIPVRIGRLIGSLEPAIVQTWLPQMDILAGVAALARGVAWVISEQASALAYRGNWRFPLRHLVGRYAAGVAANSRPGLDWWHHRNPHHELHRVIPNIVEAAPPAPPPRRSGTPRVLYLGRLHEQKRVASFIEALAIVRRYMEVDGVVCGDGPLAAELQAQAQALGLEGSLRFTGFVTDVRSYLQEADVFVSVSAFEGRPNAVEEAMASGTPVVLSDIPEHRELAGDDCAMFADGADPAAVAESIMATLLDAPAARSRVTRALERTGSFSPATVAAAWDQYYRDVLAHALR